MLLKAVADHCGLVLTCRGRRSVMGLTTRRSWMHVMLPGRERIAKHYEQLLSMSAFCNLVRASKA